MRKPDWQTDDGSIRLYNADCLSLRDELPKDAAIVSDPPYGIGYKSGPISASSISSTGKRFSEPIHGDDEPFDPRPFTDKWPCVFTGAQHFYERLPPGGSLHCWDKRGNYVPLDQADADFIWVPQKVASRVFHLVWRGICRHSENDQKIVHPTQKPMALMNWCLSFVPDAGLIIDPYMGSGTTGVVCARAGRNFIGCEIDPTHFATAVRRIEAELNRHPLFDEPKPKQREFAIA